MWSLYMKAINFLSFISNISIINLIISKIYPKMNLGGNPQILNLRNKGLVADNRIHFTQFKEKGVSYTELGTLQNFLEGQ